MAIDLSAKQTEINETFTYYVDSWRDIRAEAAKDMRYIAGDPWDSKERQAREDAGRMCFSEDELTQYVNQLINDVRQNKRAVTINPKSEGASDKSAEALQGIIREIEYESNAQAAYVCGFENAAQRSYGYWRISTEYESANSFDQKIRIKRIPNPDTVYLDPDCKEADCSDGRGAFVLDIIQQKEFKKRFPNAQITDFSAEMATQMPLWIKNNTIQIAEYWEVKLTSRNLLLLDDVQQTQIYDDELPNGEKPKVKRSRKIEKREIVQYITNGVEILEENSWAGKYIPIIPVFGKEIFVDEGSGTKRKLMSLIRLARDPQMVYAFLCSQEAEEFSMTPKTPFIGYEGQFQGHEQEWQKVNKLPLAYLQVKPTIIGVTGQLIPLPQRQPFIPNAQAYEVAKEAQRRAIASAMGISPLPTQALRHNEKSGVALQRIQGERSLGSFHFIDNYDTALAYSGKVIVDLIPRIIDTPRTVGVRKADESYDQIKVNQQPTDPNEPAVMLSPEEGEDPAEHGVTISTGPNYQSQREAALAFGEVLAQNQQFAPHIIDLIIKLQNLGPLGDEMAERLAPPGVGDQNPQQVAQQAAQLAEQNKALVAHNAQLNQIIEQKMIEAKTKVDVENISAAKDIKLALIDQETRLAVAQMSSSKDANEQFADIEWKKLEMAAGHAHEAATQAVDVNNAQDLAQQQAQMQQEQPTEGQETTEGAQ